MKKILLAVLLTALIATLTVFPGFAAEIVTDEVTHFETEATTEETTEKATEEADGAIVQEDYLTRMMESGKTWLMNNPDLVGSATAAAGVLASAIATAASSKKSRKRLEAKSDEMETKAILLNNNAVEMVETAKVTVAEGKNSMAKAVLDMIAGVKEAGESIAAELRANRMETRANSLLMAELIKDARLPEKRKDEILAMYKRERGEEAEADDADHEA